jgi:putrescine aminotransferase
MVSKRTEELAKKDAAHLLRGVKVVGAPCEVIFERGEGCKLWDTDGKQYTDISSGLVHCDNLGFGRKDLNDAAYEQMQKLSHICSAGIVSNIPAIEYAEELAKVLPGDINHVYFVSSGTEANEIAVQITRFYWALRGQTEKYKILSLQGGYHGFSHFTSSLGTLRWEPNLSCVGREYSGIVRIPNYHCYRCPFGFTYPSCNILCANFLQEVIKEHGSHAIAALIAEPIQGSAGLVWPPDEYWPIVRRICNDHDILLIADEVMNGFCRTGKFWSMDNWGIVPDILVMAKGINSGYLPLGAVGVSDRLCEHLKGNVFPSGGTSHGLATCIATARPALKACIDENLAERSARLGEHVRERLLQEFLPLPCVDDVMGRGLYQSFEIALNKTTDSEFNLQAVTEAKEYIFRRCLEQGVIVSLIDGYPTRQPVGPALVIGEGELDEALDVLLGVMNEVKPV